jgi:adenylate cyclase
MDRRLAAVLIADVAGYSRLSQADEEGTRARFQADLREVFELAIAAHRGRLVKTMGDGLLVEFASVVDALRCAVAAQRAKAERNAGEPEEQRLAFRIGINLGDVIVEGEDIHGDGVNIADRIQALAEPGGIAVSGTAYDHLRGKAEVGYADLGAQTVKNIAEPVRAYRVLLDPTLAGKTIAAPIPTPQPQAKRSWRWPAIAATALALLIAAGAAAWLRPWEPRFQPALPLPDKPSIAVLPFANMSGDPQQEYFADGITDDLITGLSKISGLFVIARNSSFTYKGKPIDVRRVAEELGVRYVLEGSIQRASEQVRINAQLVDASTGGHVWADRFDGTLADVFALQDKVTRNIADALALRLTQAEQQALAQEETRVPAAYDAFLHGWEHYRRTTPDDFAKAIPFFQDAVRLDPSYGRAHAALALVYVRAYGRGWIFALGITKREARARAERHLEQAQPRSSAMAHQVAGLIWLEDRNTDMALSEFKQAVVLDPSDSWGYAYLGIAFLTISQPEKSLNHIGTALRLDPYPPPFFLYLRGVAQFSLEQYVDAAASLEAATKANPDDQYQYNVLAATYGQLGRKTEAQAAVARFDEIMVRQGNVPIDLTVAPNAYLFGKEWNRLQQGLRLAGVPESFRTSAFAVRNRLSNEQVRSLVFGHRLHGRDFWTGEERSASVAVDGTARISGDWGSGDLGRDKEGLARFNGDELCFTFGQTWVCGVVVRNPGGTRENENELIWFRGDAMTFSQVE